MSNKYSGTGNIGQAPELRTVTIGNESRSVVNLRVYFDRNVPQENGGFEDVGGFWLSVALWGSRAESAIKLLQKGMRVFFSGSLKMESWEDDDQVTHSELRLTADHYSIDPICLESVKQRKRSSQDDVPDFEESAQPA